SLFSDEKFRRIFKELFLLSQVTRDCCEELKVALLQKDVDKLNENEATFLSTFHFPLKCMEELNEVEEYLREPNRFLSTVKELSKIGGTTPYDFVKRCVSLLLKNRFAERYSWHGAKKKQIFGKLTLANVLLESGQLCKAVTNRKEIEEAIKAWLRRAKERADKEEKNLT
ncbi:PREDICTED: uncharacterized protein LOC105571264, partial [Vollenhovia emeryi]|uniref:uncharacterized protein LOC105571264 n=1 Tax=Vollenhovia emeryi TaxID=411798 RepID=UPI0005F3A103